MTRSEIGTVTETLARRHDLLTVLEDGPKTKRDLVEATDVSRSTVDRAVRTLEADGIVRRSDGSVHLTLTGQITLDGFRQFQRGFERVHESAPILNPLDTTEALPFDLFQDAMVVRATREAPHLPIIAYQQFLEDSKAVCSVATGLIPEYVDMFHEQVVDAGMETELVVRSSVLNNLLGTYWQPVNDALSTGHFRILELSEDPDYSLKIADTGIEEVGIVVYGEQGLTGFIRSEGTDAVRWARDEYERLRDAAELVAPTDADLSESPLSDADRNTLS